MVPVLPIQVALGNSPVVMFQSIAAGVLGKAAFTGGIGAAALGVLFHVLISVIAATAFVFAASRWKLLTDRPVVSGLCLGVVAYLVMTFIVVPLSLIGFRLPKSPALFLVSFAIHLVAFGLPIAWIASKMLAGSKREA
ncbi:MAG: hypothetical protein H0X36_09855 [Sphingomonadaceae bacterium]|nr:hypothetical protein [Sphingomonadaceae bacterium]